MYFVPEWLGLMSFMADTSESPVASVPERGGNQSNKCLESLNHLWAAVEQESWRDGHEAAAVGRSHVQHSRAWWFRKPLYQILHRGESQGNVLPTILNRETLDSLHKYRPVVFMLKYHIMEAIIIIYLQLI
jgi:hypothetical protein